MKRLAIAFFYDKHGKVDEYMTWLVKSLHPFAEQTIFVANGMLSKSSQAAVDAVADTVIVRENKGFDVWAYKRALEHVGFKNLRKYDEVLLYNHTFYGPIFPFSEMFSVMGRRKCDFWGITTHQAVTPNPMTGSGTLPMHINSHFIAVRKKMLRSPHFERYWNEMPPIESYQDSVLKHESRFTQHFADLGFSHSAYINSDDYSTPYPVVLEVQDAVANRCPILKRRNFFHEHNLFEDHGANLPLALERLSKTSDYPVRMMWTNALRDAQLRNMNVNACTMKIISDHAPRKKIAAKKYGKLAVCAHVYYLDMLPELLDRASNIPVPFDLIATTDTETKAKKIRDIAKAYKNIARVEVRLMEQNRGRDISALFVTCKDIFVDSKYDLVCRLHTKKSKSATKNVAEYFKQHLLDNLLYSRDYVINTLNLMLEQPWVGIAMPPIVNISMPAIGFSWGLSKAWATDIVRYLELNVSLDDNTPVAPYGTMFWFRPQALRKIFDADWPLDYFDKEPKRQDLCLSDVLERMICYVAQDAGYTTMHIANAQFAAQSYTVLEHKLDALSSKLPHASVRIQAHYLQSLKDSAAAPHSAPETAAGVAKTGWVHRLGQALSRIAKANEKKDGVQSHS